MLGRVLYNRLCNAVGVVVAILFVALLCACNGNDMNRGDEALRIGDYDRAIANFSKVLDREPANRDARYGLAIAYYAIAEDKERLKENTLALWERTTREFKILSVIDSSDKVTPLYSTALFTWPVRCFRKTSMPRSCGFWTNLSGWILRITLAIT